MPFEGTRIEGTRYFKPNRKTQPNCQPGKPEKTGYPY